MGADDLGVRGRHSQLARMLPDRYVAVVVAVILTDRRGQEPRANVTDAAVRTFVYPARIRRGSPRRRPAWVCPRPLAHMYVPQQPLTKLTCSTPSVRCDAASHVLTREPGSPPQLLRVRLYRSRHGSPQSPRSSWPKRCSRKLHSRDNSRSSSTERGTCAEKCGSGRAH